jgi:hypothetical protein
LRILEGYVFYPSTAVRPVASAHRAACHVTHRRLLRLAQARRQLLHLLRASGCLGTSRGSSWKTSTTPLVRVPWRVARLITRLVAPLVVVYFAYAARPVASTRRTTCHVTHHRLLHLTQARHRLLRLRRAFGCLDTSCGSSRGSSSTTSTTPCVRVPRHIAQLITRLVAPLVVVYFAYTARLGAAARRAARHLLLHLCRASGCLGIS